MQRCTPPAKRGAVRRDARGSLALLAAAALGASLVVAVTSGAVRAPVRPPAPRPSTRALPAPGTAATGASAVDPSAVDPSAVDPSAVDPSAVDPSAVDPSAVDASRVDVGFLAQSVTFVSDDEGFVLGALRCGTGWCAAVRKTLDRGRSWVPVNAPPAPIDATGPSAIDALRFANPSDGFAFGPGLWETQDGGGTWRQVSLPGLVAAFAVARTRAYAVVAVSCADLSTCRAPGALFESTLGSGTWHTVSGVALRGTDLFGSDISVAGDAVYVSAGGTLIGSTTGTRFHAVDSPCPPSESTQPTHPTHRNPLNPPLPGSGVTAIAAAGASGLAVLCGGGIAGSPQVPLVYVSDDGGASYRQLEAPPLGGGDRAIALTAPTTVFVTVRSGASTVYRTTGDGSSWTAPVSFGDGGLGITDLAFVSPVDGALIHGTRVVQQADAFLSGGTPTRIAGAVGKLYLTENGGVTWTETPIAVESRVHRPAGTH
jgi:photosystem II stability/assembly factor-like uncharacterized protein